MIKYLLLLFVCLIVLFVFFKVVKINKIKKHLAKDDVKKLEVRSIGDLFFDIGFGFVKGISFLFKKSRVLKRFAMPYREFTRYFKVNIEAIDIIVIKIISGILFLIIIAFLYFVLGYKTDLMFLVVFIIGYYLPNLYLFAIRTFYRKKIDSEISGLILLWNNAYKAGKTTLQAIDVVMPSVSDYLAVDLELLKNDLKSGLEITEAFERFEERTKSPKVKYMSNIISVTEATGGNIVDLFYRLEKTLLMEEKLDQEKNSMLISSKITAIIILILPIVFYLTLSAFSPSYFYPLFNTEIGLILFGVIIILYILCIIFIIKIFKVGR